MLNVKYGNDVRIENLEFRSNLNKWNYGVRIHSESPNSVEISNCSFSDQSIIFQDYPIGAKPMKKLIVDNCDFNFENESNNIPIVMIQVHAAFLKISNSYFVANGIDGMIKNDLGSDESYIKNNNFEGDLDEDIFDFYKYEGDVYFTDNKINLSRGGIIRTKPNTDADNRLLSRKVNYEFSSNVITHTGVESSSLVYFSGLYNLENYESNTLQHVRVLNNTFHLSMIYSPLNFRGIYNVECIGNDVLGRRSKKYSVSLSGINTLKFINNTIDAGAIVGVATSSANAKKYKSSILKGHWYFKENTFNNKTKQSEFFHIKEQSGLKIDISNNFFDYAYWIVNLRYGKYEKLDISNNRIVLQRTSANSRKLSLVNYDKAKASKVNLHGNDIK